MIAELYPINSVKIAMTESHDFKLLPVMFKKLVKINGVFAVF